MANGPRKIWEIQGVGEFIAGIKKEIIKCGPSDVVVHVQFPPGTKQERSVSFAEALRREFPPHIKLVFTTHGVKMSVLRPKTVHLTLANTTYTSKDILEEIKEVLNSSADNVHITINGVTIDDGGKVPDKVSDGAAENKGRKRSAKRRNE